MASAQPAHEGVVASFYPEGMDFFEWADRLSEGRICGTTAHGIEAVAVAETLWFYLAPSAADSLAKIGNTTAETHRTAVRAMLQKDPQQWETFNHIWRGKRLPKSDEVDFLFHHQETAPLLRKRLMIGVGKRLGIPPAQGVQSVTYCVGQGVPVMETVLLLAREPAHGQGVAPELGAGFVVREMTQRDMVRAVIPPVGVPITNQEIRETVAREFGDRAPTARQIAQTIVGLRRDGELVQVSHGLQQATDLLGHPRIPSDPTRTRARS